MAMADLQQYTQSVLFGLVFSFLLAKLFSVIFYENIRITRSNPSEDQSDLTPSEHHWKSAEEDKKSDAGVSKERISGREKDDQQKKVVATGNDSEDDWEGVESTELDEAFSAASAFMAATSANRPSPKLPNDLKLQLYGLYKIATEGFCSVPQPSAIKMTARVKWNSWHKLGAMPTEEAMQKFIEIVTDLYPTWADGLKSKKRDGISDEPISNDTRPIGPVFSTSKGNEGQTELHYAADCEEEETAKLPVKRNGGSGGIKDDDGNYPCETSPGSNPS